MRQEVHSSRWLLVLAVVALIATACNGAPPTWDDFPEVVDGVLVDELMSCGSLECDWSRTYQADEQIDSCDLAVLMVEELERRATRRGTNDDVCDPEQWSWSATDNGNDSWDWSVRIVRDSEPEAVEITVSQWGDW